jgi:hypothetical protein
MKKTKFRLLCSTKLQYVVFLIHSLTPFSRVLLEKLTCIQLVKKFPAFYVTRKFITAVTSARHLSLSWASSFQSIPPHPTTWRSTLILSSHLRLGLPSGLISLATSVSEPALYRLLTFHVPNLIPLFYLLVCTKISVQFWDLRFDCFATWYVFTVRSC